MAAIDVTEGCRTAHGWDQTVGVLVSTDTDVLHSYIVQLGTHQLTNASHLLLGE